MDPVIQANDGNNLGMPQQPISAEQTDASFGGFNTNSEPSAGLGLYHDNIPDYLIEEPRWDDWLSDVFTEA